MHRKNERIKVIQHKDKDGNKIYTEGEINDLFISIYTLYKFCSNLIDSLFCF